MSTPNGPGSPNQPDGPVPQQGAPQFTPAGQGQPQPGQGQPQGGYGPQGYSGNPAMPPQGPQGPWQGQGATPGQPQPYATAYTQQGPGQPSKKSKTGLWIGLGALAVVVVVAIVLGLSGIFSGTKTTDSGAEIPKDPKEAAKTVATNYLTAISEGRAEDAKKFLKYQSDDATLLTDDVLKDSLTRAPITEITVGEPTGSSTSLTVSVTYKVGSESASDEYRVDTDGGTISTTLPTLYLNRFKGVDLTVNGATVKPQESKSNAVFPGSYTVASANKYLEVTGDTTIIRTSGTDSKSPNLELGVSQAGIELFREKVLPEAKACLESKALSPGCGITMSGELRGGETLQDGTVNRTQNAEAQSKMENVVPKVGTSVPTIISSSDFGNFEISGICTVGDRQGQCEIMAFGRSTRWGTASINVAEEDPKVQWDS